MSPGCTATVVLHRPHADTKRVCDPTCRTASAPRFVKTRITSRAVMSSTLCVWTVICQAVLTVSCYRYLAGNVRRAPGYAKDVIVHGSTPQK